MITLYQSESWPVNRVDYFESSFLWPSPSLVKGPKEMGKDQQDHRLSWKKMDLWPDNLWQRLMGCVSERVCVCVHARVRVCLLFSSANIMNLNSSFWRGEGEVIPQEYLMLNSVWTSHAVGGTRAQIRNLQPYSLRTYSLENFEKILSSSENISI